MARTFGHSAAIVSQSATGRPVRAISSLPDTPLGWLAHLVSSACESVPVWQGMKQGLPGILLFMARCLRFKYCAAGNRN